MWILLPPALLVAGIIVFLLSSYSPLSSRYQQLTAEKAEDAAAVSAVFTETDISGLPLPVQRYFRYCGYLGTPKMSSMRAFFEDVDFVLSESRTIKIDYQQFNLVERPERLAYISSSLFGIPFEGLDSYENGKGSMKGVLAKGIPLFDQRGESMDRASLVTWLAECLLVPNAALQDFVKWEPIDDTHAKASIVWEGVSASGIFTFADSGELCAFRTGDRVAVDMNGNETKADWSAYLREYQSVGGILQPKNLQSVWHYSGGDCVYFNENASAVAIRYQ
jgi:hypothetical protein